MPALSLLTMGALLKQNGHEVSVIDLAGVEDYKSYIENEKHKLDCDWLGFGCTTPQFNEAQRIRDYIKNYYQLKIPIVCGGMHITSEVYANEMGFLNNGGFDSYCTGEGYNSILKMCEDLKEEGRLRKLYTEPIWKDVDTLPYADRDLVDIRSYKYKLGNHPATTIYTSYGCYYECSFCESKMAGSYTVRNMSPERIKAEVKYIRDRWGFTGFMDFSDELNLNRDRFLGICRIYKELEDVVWRGFLVTAKWDEEMARAAKESNCYQIATGIESFSPIILRGISKPSTPELNKRFVRICKKAGLNTKVFMILGLPNESWETVAETDKALTELKNEGSLPDDLDCSVLQVYHGSNIYRDRHKLDIEFDDYIDNTEKLYYKSSPKSYSELIQVNTKGMTKYDLISSRNYLEYKYKKSNWLEDYTGRKDLDRVQYNEDVMESIHHAEKMLAKVRGKP